MARRRRELTKIGWPQKAYQVDIRQIENSATCGASITFTSERRSNGTPSHQRRLSPSSEKWQVSFWFRIRNVRRCQFRSPRHPSPAGYFSQDARQCKQFLRHKSFTVSPAVLAKDGCRPNVLVQQQGEFVITYPRGYHSGYNLGFNCAESINFALDSWIELGRRAQFCTCVDDSVRIDVDAVLAESALLEAIELERVERKRQVEAKRLDRAGSSKRRVRGSEDSSMPRKRRKIDIAADPVAAAEAQDKARKHAESSRRRTCMFCPDTTNFPTLPVFSSPEKESRGTPPLRGHIACARSIPELWIEETQSEGSSKLLVIMGSDNIPRDRWNLVSALQLVRCGARHSDRFKLCVL